MIICVVVFMQICLVKYSSGYFHLYDTSNMVENQTTYFYDCFYGSIFSTTENIELLLRSYCIRPDEDDNHWERIKPTNESQILGERFTFFELRQLNITGENLYDWSAPIHTIEHYQLYLTNSSVENGIFYNCSSPFWFGSFCQYTLNSLDSFHEIVIQRFQFRNIDALFLNDVNILNITTNTCYMHLQCNRGPSPMCLDWREICDTKCDCIDNCIDEENCFQLEINQCNQEQFRCNNGMCIPKHLFRDRHSFIDCMDASDETDHMVNYRGGLCYQNRIFDCDTFTCSGFDLFSCGDGQCSILHPPVYPSRGCRNQRDLSYAKALFMYTNASDISEKCWLAIICSMEDLTYYITDVDCTHPQQVQLECPSRFVFPLLPTLFKDIRFVYEPNNTDILVPNYICYNAKWCDKFLQETFFIDGLTCKYLDTFSFFNTEQPTNYHHYTEVELFFKHWCPLPKLMITDDGNCSHSALFHCKGTSKCISKYRLLDRNIDCYQSYDELFNGSCSLNLSHRFSCPSDGKCIPQVQLKDGNNDCLGNEDELIINRDCVLNRNCYKDKIIFSKICDGFTEILPILIDNQNETDETNCQFWSCDTQYTRCDKVWNCYNGADELNCSYILYPYNCKANEHHCIRVDNNKQGISLERRISRSCLSVEFAGDKQMNCLGSIDERDYCRLNYPNETNRRYRCWNDTTCIDIHQLCDCKPDCPLNDDEVICSWLFYGLDECHSGYFTCSTSDKFPRKALCEGALSCPKKDEALICDLNEWNRPVRKYFSIGNYFLRYPDIPLQNGEHSSSTTKSLSYEQKNAKNNDLFLQWYCNQGVLVYSFDQKFYCFCPPAYYGDRCQYQNEFIGLILNVRRKSARDHLFVFRIVIVLLNDNKSILFQEQILYTSSCEKQYQMYLLYPNRPKLQNRNYSIRLDIYAMHHLHNTIQFRTSFYHMIPFTFLPVHRFVVDLAIPEKQAQVKLCDDIQCHNGKCYQYENLNQFYCRCDYGWFGEYCHLRYQCNCSPQSICTETGCVCPLGKAGSLCYFPEVLSCKSIICQHGGTCISRDERLLEKDSQCFCTEEYEGKFCENRRMRITIRFNNVLIPSSILIHYLISQKLRNPDHLTQFKRISVYENVVILYPSMTYDMAFVQFDNNYYLIFLDSIPASGDINTHVIPSNKCPYIEELLDRHTFLFHPLKRIKYYPLICRNNLNHRCFYDQTQLCLCTKTHLTDCFDFNHNGTSSCDENNYCENKGKCYINDLSCPTKSICVCQQCYYGTLCQFTTSGSVLSLDSIIGYHIQPYLSFLKQTFIIKLTAGITIMMLSLGIMCNILSIMTFSREKILEFGCGIYLLSSSILSFITMIIVAYKFWSLLAMQMALITNDIFLIVHCKMIDFLLRFLSTTIEWLNACVAIERVLNITLGIHFDKTKSKSWAKFTVIIVILINIISVIHDPLNRRLLEDTEEQRIWCIVSYTHSSWLNIYNTSLNIIHFIVPFIINFISACVIIVNTARKRSDARKNQTFREHLKEQFEQHKHLLISSSILVILALPRLIISFFSGCMKSARDPWLFLAAYFISFIPAVLIFFIFVIPSETYRTQFSLSWKHQLAKIRR